MATRTEATACVLVDQTQSTGCEGASLGSCVELEVPRPVGSRPSPMSPPPRTRYLNSIQYCESLPSSLSRVVDGLTFAAIGLFHWSV